MTIKAQTNFENMISNKIPRKLKKKFKALLIEKTGTTFSSHFIRVDELTKNYIYQGKSISFRDLSLTSHRMT
jgi:hypothetical protein